jgi:hypothetical protein
MRCTGMTESQAKVVIISDQQHPLAIETLPANGLNAGQAVRIGHDKNLCIAIHRLSFQMRHGPKRSNKGDVQPILINLGQ